jgi:hypothetical protein
MARLERLKYLPMLVRAYQEARNRAQAEWNGEIDSMNAARSAAVQESAPERKQNTHFLERPNARKPRPVQQRGALKGNAVTRGRGNTIERAVQTRQSAGKRAGSVLAKTAPKGKVQPRRPAAFRSNIGQDATSLRHVLSELRAAKQQLTQLQAIQTQLTRVQLQLDQQLQVLRKSVASSSSLDMRSSNLHPDMDSNTETQYQTNHAATGEQKQMPEGH